MSLELEEARSAVAATRGVLKASHRSLRTSLQFLADLDERLTALERTATEEAQRQNANDKTINP